MRIPEIFLALLIISYCITLPSLTKRAGHGSVLSYIPILQFFPFLKTIGRPWWWFLLLLIPGVNLLMLVIINVELGIAFGKRKTGEQWLFGALPWFALFQLAFKEKDAAYVGKRDWTGKKKSFGREWGEALIFAVIAASVIRGFFLEAFTIPTPSMERSMLVGDYLFVSKMSYGAKIPQTPVSVPFVHNALPGSMTNSYVDWFSLPYFRLPGFGKVDRYDPVVFNFPHGDTIIVDAFYAGHDYYGILRKEAQLIFQRENPNILKNDTTGYGWFDVFSKREKEYFAKARDNFDNKNICLSCTNGAKASGGLSIGGLKARPIDKKENYIKRCIGLPGDKLEVINRQVLINGKPIENPAGLQYGHVVRITANYTDDQTRNAIIKIADAHQLNFQEIVMRRDDVIMTMTEDIAKEVAKLSYVDSVYVFEYPKEENNLGQYFPNVNAEPYKHWTVDNFGPVHIPAKGETIELTLENLPLYQRVIDVYEENDLRVEGNKIFINGAESKTYTFKSDYYWMMGDNRHNSADSRVWGFVPENHVVGKAVFTWFSKEDPNYRRTNNIRWNRMFRLVD
jgi:signal peptidase I